MRRFTVKAEVGPTELPYGLLRIAGVVTPWAPEGDQVPAGRRWVGCFVDSCRSATVARAASRNNFLQAGRETSPYNSIGKTASQQGGYSEAIVVDETRVAHTRRAAPGCGGAAVVRGHRAVLATAPLECRGERVGDHRPDGAGSRASSWAPRWAPT